jgi:hypothetical protein
LSISYPLVLPASPPGFRGFQMLGHSTVGVSKSPFTGTQQAYEFPGEWWEIQASLPPMTRADAERWISFLLALRGRAGTFLAGDPLGKIPMGNPSGSPFVNAAGQTGKTLAITGLGGTLKAGDYFQVGGENRLLFSQAFDNVAWNYISATRPTADTIVAPDGTTTAEAIVSTSALPQVFQNLPVPSFTPGQKYTFSIWLKAPAGALSVTLLLANGTSNFGSATVSLTTGWQRFSVSGTATTSGVPVVGIFTWTSGVTVHAWGAQVEIGPSANADYFVTTSAPLLSTRRLYKNLTDQSGSPCTLDIFPRLHESPIATFSAGFLVFTNPQGLFRLATNDQSNWTVDVAQRYGLGFAAVEAL